MHNSKIKICGIKNINTLKCCIENKIDFFGLLFFKNSPRNIEVKQALKLLNYSKNKPTSSVGVFVNEKIDDLNSLLKILKINYIQLHGNENNDYINSIKKNNKIKVIKSISIKNENDVKKISTYKNADMFLFDYKPSNKELPGGNSKSFDWNLIKNIKIEKNWFLSGGINVGNIKDIKKFAIPYGIDISSGVEVKRGIKSNKKIAELIKIYESK